MKEKISTLKKLINQNTYLFLHTLFTNHYSKESKKLRILLFFIISITTINTFSQTNFIISSFSDKYKGMITLEKSLKDEIIKKGKTTIIDLKTNKKVIEIKSNALHVNIDKRNAITTNALKLPYPDQNIIIYQDFNFDGINDLAILDGTYSCYGSPTYQIYLETKQGLKHSPEFTRLAQEYCGMFKPNYKNKTIHTMMKSGCCRFTDTYFKIISNSPKPFLIVKEDPIFNNIEEGSISISPFRKRTKTTWDGNKKSVEITKYINLEEEEITKITSFKLIKNQKQVLLFSVNNRMLYYALIKPNKTIEFSYPIELSLKKSDFKINKTEDKLTFNNNGATYKIYNTLLQNKIIKVGIIVEINGRTYDLKGDINSLTGSLKNVKKIKLYNVVNE
ncbi:XAC2610-related protein [Tenacibaculum ovolyticum]|uniref:XAC2610-related protein n=1 Tax=Tenacibaculum ovolyticum TaxID=104270 RepID=UPI001F20480F|nr:hypothetical protein [Tenacibaculum ovolyticum]